MKHTQKLSVKNWAQFDRKVRFSGKKLLCELDRYQDAILVAGCQRSGTTALTRLITSSNELVGFQFGSDDELDAALILSGSVSHTPLGRYCFQTTYLNDSYPEYYEHNAYKLIWVLRNPASVIYSMLYNWRRSALNRLFSHCGVALLSEREKWRYERFGVFAVSRLMRACLSYNAKVSQIFKLRQHLGDNQLFIVDYEQLTNQKSSILPVIYDFLHLQYQKHYADKIHSDSVHKAYAFSARHGELLDRVCMPVYRQACALAHI